MKKILKGLLYFILSLILLFGFFLGYNTVKDYKPEAEEVLFEGDGAVINIYDTLNFLNWNVGYCGLGSDMDFFYDGGKQTRTSEERTNENFNKIAKFLKQNDSIDFYLLQEVDQNSKRSYHMNQFSKLGKELPDFHSYFAYNYKVLFVPVPANDPMGKVEGGLATFCKEQPFKVKRHSFPGNYEWPKGLFMLDRCFMVKRFYTSNGKELVIINTHNSAYDTGNLRKQQMKLIREFLLAEYEKGNYVIIGGDWNQNPPKAGEKTSEHKDGHLTRIKIDNEFMPAGWQWIFSEDIPTNRMLYEPYNKETTITAVIDFYLISPNIISLAHKNVNLNFENSDHHPIFMSVLLKH
ncbi:MAG: hypothetical protein JEZ09_08060 [Salinivirgaceae bacterium]|nr:hypothetical protein [Salinivirgaceae bacterium]